MTLVALDIGGANVKISDGDRLAASYLFPLWKSPEGLSGKLREILGMASPANTIAVTMTGELADCYPDKASGVRSILAALKSASGNAEVIVYSVSGEFISLAEAAANPLSVAAANWHALARFAAQLVSRSAAVLLDIGSTTTDIIPCQNGQVATQARTDPERLLNGNLVYTGVRRSPVCALVRTLTWRGRRCGVAQEYFATTSDVYRLLDLLPEEPDSFDTADGRAATKEFSHDRMARMICADRSMVSLADAVGFAREVFDSQSALLARPLKLVIDSLPVGERTCIICGEGEFLARDLLKRCKLDCEVLSLTDQLDRGISIAAAAHAVAVLARQRSRP